MCVNLRAVDCDSIVASWYPTKEGNSGTWRIHGDEMAKHKCDNSPVNWNLRVDKGVVVTSCTKSSFVTKLAVVLPFQPAEYWICGSCDETDTTPEDIQTRKNVAGKPRRRDKRKESNIVCSPTLLIVPSGPRHYHLFRFGKR